MTRIRRPGSIIIISLVAAAWGAGGAGIAGCASPQTPSSQESPPGYAPPTEMKLENLLHTALAEEFTPGREIVVSYVELPPNTTMESHWHPGEEFHYYMEGDIEVRIDGGETIRGTPGTVGHVPYKAMHTAVSGPRGARALVFRVHTEGEPVRYLEEGGASDR